jgi:ribonuclease HI
MIADGGYKNNLAYGSFKVYDNNGEMVGEKQFVVGIGTNNQAEYIALINALYWCKRNDIKRVVVVMDSKLIINQVKKIWRCKDKRLVKLRDTVWEVMNDLEYVEIMYTPGKYIKQKLGH